MNALILVDLQNDFLPGGALAVAAGDQVIPLANQLQRCFELVVATQDWHPADHGSFSANYDGKRPGELIDLHGLPQVLWPIHCVQHTLGAELSEQLDLSRVAHIVRKRTDPTIDSYSGFFDNQHRKATGLDELLKRHGVNDVCVLGLATDYCVKFTALDARHLGYRTSLIVDACRGVDLQPGDVQRAIDAMRAAGVKIVESRDILNKNQENHESTKSRKRERK